VTQEEGEGVIGAAVRGEEGEDSTRMRIGSMNPEENGAIDLEPRGNTSDAGGAENLTVDAATFTSSLGRRADEGAAVKG